MDTSGCFPNKVKKPESSATWRRRENKSKSQKRLNSTPPPPSGRARPTILLPPMQWSSDSYPSTSPDAAATSPAISTSQDRVSSPTAPVSPSAPSPGEVFYNSEDQSDIAFIVPDGEREWRFPAHSFIIKKMEATREALMKSATEVSSVPKRGDDVGSSLAQPGDTDSKTTLVVRLNSISPCVFNQLLRFIYTHQVSLSSIESSLRLLQPAQTYHLPDLTSQCLSYISSHLTPSEVLKVISHFLRPCIVDQQKFASSAKCSNECHHNDNLKNELLFQCFQLIDQHADFILQSEDFETLEQEAMMEIIKRDSLEVSSEAVVFDAIMRWACTACKRQRRELTSENKCVVLGKALFLVRYLVMTEAEFLRGPVAQGVLSAEDKEVMLSRISAKPDTAPLPMPDHWLGWKISQRRQKQDYLAVTSPTSDRLSSPTTNASATPTESLNKSIVERKKKSMSKKLLNGVGDLVICVIHMLD